MPLRLGNEAPPYIEILDRPSVWAACEDIVWHDIVVSESGYYRYREAIRAMALAALSKDFGEFRDHVFVLLDNLLLRPWYILVVVVSRRVARPYYEVYMVLYVVFYPLESLVDERKGRIAAGCFCAVQASGSMSAMARCIRFCARICLVKRVWMEVCVMQLVATLPLRSDDRRTRNM